MEMPSFQNSILFSVFQKYSCVHGTILANYFIHAESQKTTEIAVVIIPGVYVVL